MSRAATVPPHATPGREQSRGPAADDGPEEDGRREDGPRLDQQLCFALYAATHAITRSYRTMLGEIGLTYPQYLVLLVLMQHGACTVQGVANALRLNASTLTPLLKRLAEAGLVRRQRDAGDERVVSVSLTRKGAELRQVLAQIQQQVVCRTGLDEGEFAALRSSLHALVDRLADTPAPG